VIATLRRLHRLGEISRPRAASCVVLGMLVVAFGVALITTAGYLISRAAEHPPILSLTVAIVLVRLFGLSRPIARYLDRLAAHDVALRALGRIRVAVYERIEPLAPARLEGYRGGELLSRLVRDVDSLQGLFVRGLVPPIVALVVGAACVGAVYAMLPAAALVLAVGLLIAGAAVPALSHVLGRSAGRSQSPLRAELTSDLVELLQGAPELAVYGREADTLERITAADAALVRAGRRDASAAGVGDGLSILVAGATTTAVLALAVAAHHTGTLARVLVATLALLALSSFEAVNPLASSARELSANTTAGTRVLELLDREPSVADPADPIVPATGPRRVALEGVTARYAGSDTAALEGFDLDLSPGRRVALVGESGAGKTTVTNLLLRFLDPERGRVAIAGRDAREYRQEDVRATFALAGQDAHVFDTTIRGNLLVARPDASDTDLADALSRARLSGWVASLPDGLDTLVGENGNRLSGGQRQRLTIARALLSEAPVLLLDEPTAHLDVETAEQLARDVLGAAGERAVLLITHRPEGLDLVDEIVRLEQGHVVERRAVRGSDELDERVQPATA
jgi:thiol reductant ABC exporter CydC subunit